MKIVRIDGLRCVGHRDKNEIALQAELPPKMVKILGGRSLCKAGNTKALSLDVSLDLILFRLVPLRIQFVTERRG